MVKEHRAPQTKTTSVFHYVKAHSPLEVWQMMQRLHQESKTRQKVSHNGGRLKTKQEIEPVVVLSPRGTCEEVSI